MGLSRTTTGGLAALFGFVLVTLSVPAEAQPAQTLHSFDITYRNFGRVSASSSFRSAKGYDVRFEGCFAKTGPEAICGFTLRAQTSLILTNGANLSHGTRQDGEPMRTCCLFLQGRPEGRPIIPPGAEEDGAAVIRESLSPGMELGVMLRLPDYKVGSPLSAITFSRGEDDPGLSFPAAVQPLP
jgi:hypothetical protein